MALLIRTLLVLFVFAAGAAGASAAEAWRIVASTGAVKAGAPGMMPIAVNPKQELPVDSWIETAASGRAVLARGSESIAIGPNSRVMLPALPVNGNTQVLQTMGSALYQIGKQKAPHFQVDTPYLAAVVKGTTFTVSVSEGVAAVDVTEGLVQVATPDGADSAYVQPGFTGFVTRSQRDTVVVAPTGSAPGATDTPKGKAKVNPIGSSPKDSSTDRVIITAAIGEVSLDVKSVSGGLVTGTQPAPATGGTKASPTLGNAVSGVSDTVRDVKNSNASAPSLSASVGGVASVDVGVSGSGAGASVDVGGGVASVDVSAGGGGVGVGAEVGGGVASVDVSAGSGGIGAGVDVGGVAGVDVAAGGGGVSVDVGAGGAGVSVDLGVGGGNGNGSGSGVGLGVGIGAGGGGVTVGVGVGNGGVGVGVDLGLGGGGGGLLRGLLGGGR